jgi:hypothetical protein
VKFSVTNPDEATDTAVIVDTELQTKFSEYETQSDEVCIMPISGGGFVEIKTQPTLRIFGQLYCTVVAILTGFPDSPLHELPGSRILILSDSLNPCPCTERRKGTNVEARHD